MSFTALYVIDLRCVCCTEELNIHELTKKEAWAKTAGWKIDKVLKRAICPDCKQDRPEKSKPRKKQS